MTRRPIKELTYSSSGNVLQIWTVEGPVRDTFNEPLDDDGLYAIVRLDDPSDVVGWEIIEFTHYASVHPQWLPLADAFSHLPGGALTWSDPAGLQQLLPA